MKISKIKNTEKPTGRLIGNISKEIEKVDNKKPTFDDFGEAIENGQSFVLANFEGARKNESFISTSWFALDFDKTIVTLDERVLQADELNLGVALAYYSFSANLTDSFNHRLVFQTEKEHGAREANAIIHMLQFLFEDSDTATSDLVRLWFGSNRKAEVIGQFLDVSELITQVKMKLYTMDNSTSLRSKKTQALAQRMGINIINGQLNIGDTFETASWNVTDLSIKMGGAVNKRTGNFKPEKYDVTSSTIEREIETNPNWEMIFEIFPLIEQSLKGEYWLTYEELRMMALNMVFFKGGMKLLHAMIDKYDFYENDIHNRSYYHWAIDDVTSRYSSPENWKGYFTDYHEHGKNLVSAYQKLKQPFVKLEKGANKMSVQQAFDLTDCYLQNALSDSASVSVIKTPTGVGKTQLLTEEFWEFNAKKTVIAFPTHALKSEVALRWNTVGVAPAVSVKRPQLPMPYRSIYESMMRAGNLEGANAYYKKTVKKHLSKVDEYKEFTSSIKHEMDSNVVLTTHARALHMDYQADLVIFDEDVFFKLFDQNEIKVADIRKLYHITKNPHFKAYLSEMIEWIDEELDMQLDALEYKNGVKFDSSLNELKPIKFNVATEYIKLTKMLEDGVITFDSPVLKILDGGFYNLSIKMGDKGITQSDSITLVKKPELPKVKKIIILSATANERLYEMAFDDVKFYDVGDVENQGTVIQYLDWNTSKSQLSKHSEEIDNVIIQSGLDVTRISYKQLSKLDEMHIHNTEGFDSLKGKDTAIIGTPMLSESMYNLYAFALTGKIPYRLANRTVERNGFKFKFFTYEDVDYRELQFALIEEKLIQAVGRSRAVRHEATVFVFSHFPIKADKHIFKDEEL